MNIRNCIAGSVCITANTLKLQLVHNMLVACMLVESALYIFVVLDCVSRHDQRVHVYYFFYGDQPHPG